MPLLYILCKSSVLSLYVINGHIYMINNDLLDILNSLVSPLEYQESHYCEVYVIFISSDIVLLLNGLRDILIAWKI